jgi:hypothetical protein
MRKLLGILVLSMLLTGCIPKVSPTGGSFSGLKTEPDKSRIIILRKGGSLIGMDTPAVNISGTTSSSYYLPSKAFIQEDVIVGKYEIVVKKPVGTGLVWRMDPINIFVKAIKNKTVYLELKATSIGLVHSAKIEVVDEAYALDKLKVFQRVLRTDRP